MKNKKKLTLTFIFFAFTCLYSQNFTVNVENLKAGDSVLVIAKKGVGSLLKKWINSTDNPNAASFNLENGDWAIKIEAARYTYPSQKVVSIPNDIAATFALTEMLEGDYTYNWIDDESAAGHATQSYIAEPTEIIVLNDTVSVPSDFTSIKLRTEYGIILSDDKEKWSNEDAYRLYKMFSNLPYNTYGEGNSLDFSSGENVRGVFYLTEDEIYEDISIEDRDGIKHATVSQSAFTYAEPQIVTIDGIRGKFYSKRLYHTVVNFITDFGNDNEVLAWLALERFGIKFLTPSDFDTFLEEDSSNFQEFYNSEKLEILSMFEELPEGFHKQDGLKNLIRRIDGQDHPDPSYAAAAAIAWTGVETLEFMSKAFIGGNLSDTRRLILHEKAHFLWAYSFDQTTKDDWTEIGGWFEDSTSPSGWSTYNSTEFVSAYAHLKNPNEDMAESIAFYLTNPDLLIGASPLKFEFIRDRIMHGTRYVSLIQEDLTFTVYNLFPDYTFPGKIVELDLNVEGADEEDKTVTMTVRLASTNPEVDGATVAYTRFNSSIGTNFDIRLYPQNGSIDSVLVGTATLSKYAKSGYWNMSSISVTDQVGNKRYENTSTVGAKLFIQNPLEDITPPEFIEFSMARIDSTFDSSGNLDPNGTTGQAIKLNSKWEEPLQLSSGNRAIVRVDFPNPNQAETYFKEARTEAKDPDAFLKDVEGYFFIEDYYPSGYYGVVQMYTSDIAGNSSRVTFTDDIENFPYTQIGNVAALKDSVFVETLYPDILKPEIDLNNITVIAEPTNPVAPNGETRVDINFNARDLSDFPGHESGVYIVKLTLRDPQGRKTGYQTGNGTMNHPDLDLADTDPVLDSLWRNYRFDLVLPQGSAAGVWGISDIVVIDKVGNTKSYNFEEYVRFDIIESDIELDAPLEIEIVDKVVNAGNVTAIKAQMSCSPCAGLNFVATIYSRFGGGAVVRSEGVLESDEVIVENLDTSGILDGEVNLTVQITDADNRLVATKTSAYTKDVVYPKAYYSRSNLENEGTSSLDDWVVEVVIESVDINGTYNLDIDDANTSESGRVQSLSFEGDLSSEITILENLDISNLENGDYKFDLKVTDPNGNLGESEILYYRKNEETITLLGNQYVPNITWSGSINNDWDTSGNWLNGIIPNSSNDVIIPSNLSNYPTASSAIVVNSMTLSSGASFIAQSTFTGSLTYNRTLPTNNWYLVSSSVVGETLDNLISNHTFATGSSSNIGIAPYVNDGSAWEYQTNSATGALAPGSGYSVKLVAAGDISFNGTFPTSDVSIGITQGTANNFNLIGNPYPSYIAANSNADAVNNLLTINSSILSEETLWFWDSGSSSYITYNQASDSKFVPPAQGFFVSSNGANNFQFTEAMQSHQSDSFQRTINNRPEINLMLSSGTSTTDTEIFYIDGTTTGWDNGYDSSIFGGTANSFAIYTHLVSDSEGQDLGIQSLPDTDLENMIVPVGINADSETEITISVATQNLPDALEVYLEDKEEGSFTLLSSDTNYTTILSEALNGIGRYYLHASAQALSTDELIAANISLYMINSNTLRVVGAQSEVAQIKVHSMLGKQVYETSFQGNGMNDVDLPKVAKGLYLIQLETARGVLNKKIFIE